MQQNGQRFISDVDELLVSACEDHLRLLHAVDCFPGVGGLYDGPAVDRAVGRYEFFWLPFLDAAERKGLDLNQLVPPLDIAWAWHVHRLNPEAYEADCQKIIRLVIRPSGRQAFRFSDGKDSQSRYTRKHWKKCFPDFHQDMPYFPKKVNYETLKGKTSSSCLSMDLPSAMKCQASLLRQILQPAIINKTELREMVRRYALFLELRKQAPGIFSVPPVDVDFIWHTHMSMNREYENMCQKHFGGLVSHKTVSPDDKAASLTRDSGFNDTQKAWAELFPDSPYLSPRWDNNMPSVHPFVIFMENIDVNLELLYGDGSGRRAGSHALHAMAVLLEMRRKFDSDDSCGYTCCVAPGRRTNYGMPSTLANDLGQKYARLPLSSTSKWLSILHMAIPFDGPPQGVTEAIHEAGIQADRDKYGRRRPVPSQFTQYRTGPGNLYVVAAIGSGYCGNVGGCGGAGGGAAGGSCGGFGGGCGGGGFGGGGCGGGGGGGGGGCGGGGGGGC